MQSEKIQELAAALGKAQAAIRGAQKDGRNPHFRSMYATLDSVWQACREQLTSNGFSVLQTFGANETVGDYMETLLLHTSGQWVSSRIRWAPPGGGSDAQKLGSYLTYLRRYALSALVGVAPTDDDDGEAAVGRAAGGQHKPSSPPLIKSILQADEVRAEEFISSIPTGDTKAIQQWEACNLPVLKRLPEPARKMVWDAMQEALSAAQTDETDPAETERRAAASEHYTDAASYPGEE